MRYFWDAWPTISRRILSNARRTLLLDFDGTLAPISRDPASVTLNPEIRKLLYKLSKSKRTTVAIISGRSLDDLRSRVGLSRILYVGNHGFEAKGCGFSLPTHVKKAKRFCRAIAILSQKMRAVFQDWPGVLIDDKQLTLSLHFRNVPGKNRVIFTELVKYLKGHSRRLPLIWKRGKCVWEVKPDVCWDKGKAVLRIQRRFPGLTIAIGDDLADEDMFREVREEGIAVRVHPSRQSAADYYFKSTREVEVFLKKLCHP